MGELFRRFWLPALMPEELPQPDCPPVRIRLLGEDLVAFRDSAGQVGVVVENCPHRGASLFFGRNEEEGLRCVYHGWKFDTSGACLDMPNEPPESNFRSKVRVTAYRAREHGGLIWVYMGPEESNPELPQLEWTAVPASHRHLVKWRHESNYAQGLEGDIDTSHVSFLHRYFAADADPNGTNRGRTTLSTDPAPRLMLKETDYGFVYGGRRAAESGSHYWRVTQFLLPTFSIIPTPVWPMSGHAYIPMDDEHTWVFAYFYHPERPLTAEEVEAYKSGARLAAEVRPGTFWPVLNRSNEYGLDREVQRTRSFSGIFGGNAQDRAVVESMGPILDRTKEHVGTADLAVIAFRRLLLRLARQLQKGIEPYAASHGDAYRVRSLDVIEAHADLGPLIAAHEEELLAHA